MDQDPPVDPIVQVAGGAGVNIVGLGIGGERPPANDVRQVVRAEREVPLLHLRGDLVVRLRDQAIRLPGGGRIAVSAKGKDLGHTRNSPA